MRPDINEDEVLAHAGLVGEIVQKQVLANESFTKRIPWHVVRLEELTRKIKELKWKNEILERENNLLKAMVEDK